MFALLLAFAVAPPVEPLPPGAIARLGPVRLRIRQDEGEGIKTLRFDTTGRRLYSLDANAVFTTWDVERRAMIRHWDFRDRLAVSRILPGEVSISSGGDRLAMPTNDQGEAVFDTRTGRPVVANDRSRFPSG